MRSERLINFSNACEHFLASLTANGPLSESEARLVAYYCKEIYSMLEPSCLRPAP